VSQLVRMHRARQACSPRQPRQQLVDRTWPHRRPQWRVEQVDQDEIAVTSLSIAVAIKPRYAAYIVAAWLAGIIINLLSYPGFYDVALRDFGLLLGRPDPGSTGFCVRPGLASTDPGAQLISLPL